MVKQQQRLTPLIPYTPACIPLGGHVKLHTCMLHGHVTVIYHLVLSAMAAFVY